MHTTARRLVHAAGLALVGAGLLALGPTISREGEGEHREKLAAMESVAFPAEAMAGLLDWVGGDPVSAETTAAGGVTVIAFVKAENGASMTILNTLTRLARENADKGLQVFAVHPEKEWEVIKAKADEGRLRVPVALDAGGKFAAALHADDDPDLYLIDRAGQLRYADIETRSLAVAISSLLRETPEQAKANAATEAQARRIAMEEDGPAKERKGPTPANSAGDVEPSAYAKADWPAKNEGRITANNVQGRRLAVPFGNETWLSEKMDVSGKVMVLDFWATWCGPCIRASPTLDQLQRSNRDSVAIIGVGGQGEDIETVRAYVNKNRHSYGHVFDANQRIYKSLQVNAIPHVVVISTDGVVRWQGNPLSPEFKAAVEQVIKVDPGLAKNKGP